MHSFRDDADEDAESWRISASSHEDEAYALGSRSGEDGRSAEVPRSAEERAVYDEEEGKFVEGGEEGAWSDGEGEEGDEGEWTEEEYEEGEEGEWEEEEGEEGEWEEGEEEEGKIRAGAGGGSAASGPPPRGGGGGWLSRWWGGKSTAEERSRGRSEGDYAADESGGRQDSRERTDDDGLRHAENDEESGDEDAFGGAEEDEEAMAALDRGATLQDRSSATRPLAVHAAPRRQSAAAAAAAAAKPSLSTLRDQPEGSGTRRPAVDHDVSPTPALSAVVRDMRGGASLADDAAGGVAPEWMRAALAERAARMGKLQRLESDFAEVDERRAALAVSLVAKDATLAAHVAAHGEQLGALRRELGAAEAKERVATAAAAAAAATSGKLERKLARLGALAVELEARLFEAGAPSELSAEHHLGLDVLCRLLALDPASAEGQRTTRHVRALLTRLDQPPREAGHRKQERHKPSRRGGRQRGGGGGGARPRGGKALEEASP